MLRLNLFCTNEVLLIDTDDVKIVEKYAYEYVKLWIQNKIFEMNEQDSFEFNESNEQDIVNRLFLVEMADPLNKAFFIKEFETRAAVSAQILKCRKYILDNSHINADLTHRVDVFDQITDREGSFAEIVRKKFDM